MLFNIEWLEDNQKIIWFIDICNHRFVLTNYFFAFIQYLCFVIVYILIMKLIKNILNKDSDKYF